MRKATTMTIEITGYLILSSIVTIAVIMICPPLIKEPRENIVETIRRSLALILMFCSAPTLVPFYLFQRQRFATRMIVPVASLLLQTAWMVCLQRDIFSHMIAILFPVFCIAVATILTAYLPIVRKGDFPISTAKLALGVAAELLLTIILPLTIALLLSLTK